jgi:hypothetical protein
MSQKLETKIHDSYVNIFVAITAKIVVGIIEFRHSFLEAFDFWFDGETVLA